MTSAADASSPSPETLDAHILAAGNSDWSKVAVFIARIVDAAKAGGTEVTGQAVALRIYALVEAGNETVRLRLQNGVGGGVSGPLRIALAKGRLYQPAVARFAQAFPGTMPYSESIGFIANLEHADDIDMVFYVVAHEMAHQWQHHYGKPSRVGYHNAEWADKMQSLGLRPTRDGTPEGKVTGQRVGHLIIQGGPFDIAARQLMSRRFVLSWYDRLAEMSEISSGRGGGSAALAEPTAGKRFKFTCPTCQANAWGRASLRLVCGDCNATMASA